MLGKVDELAETAEHMAVPFVLGESVKVIDGPFRDFTGTVEKIFEEKRKLEVTVKIFGRYRRIQQSRALLRHSLLTTCKFNFQGTIKSHLD